jgi:hypothetical protein
VPFGHQQSARRALPRQAEHAGLELAAGPGLGAAVRQGGRGLDFHADEAGSVAALLAEGLAFPKGPTYIVARLSVQGLGGSTIVGSVSEVRRHDCRFRV